METGEMVSRQLAIVCVFLLLSVSTEAQNGDGCGYTVLGPESGTFTSINYPQTYPNSTVCEWEIRVKPGDRIHLKFGDFDIEDSNSCHFNYVRIYDGIGPTRSEIAKYCGLALQLEDPIESKSNVITVQFMSGTHISGRGFLASYSTTNKTGLHRPFSFSKHHCYLSAAWISPPLLTDCAGTTVSVAAWLMGPLSSSLFTFKTFGCYGTLGMESGVIPDSQINASSILEWTDNTGQYNIWNPEKARLKKTGPSWAAAISDEHQWLQIDLNKMKKITGIITTGSNMHKYNFYVSAYKVLYGDDGSKWKVYKEPHVEQDKVFQGNSDCYQEVRNNFIPPIVARYVKINPVRWHQKIALKAELLGCPFIAGWAPKLTVTPPIPLKPRAKNNSPLQPETEKITFPPEIKNTTVSPNITKDVPLAAILVPVLVMVFTSLLLILVCAWHWRNRKKKSEGTYDLPYWDRAGWWKGMKQFLPAKSAEHEETPVRYSSSEISRLRAREVTTMSAEYAQPLVGGAVGTLHQRSTFKPEEGKEPGYAELDSYNSPDQEIYHAYAEPLPTNGPEYATPIVMDMSGHPGGSMCLPSTSTFKATGTQGPPLVGGYSKLLSKADSSASTQILYDTPKGVQGANAMEEMVYQVPQGVPQPTTSKDICS
ncbi:discoidin, CUB and LCCL domain-containing protein 2 [Bombina bombina]|uniref:discoidin, CUB and LCCL domain-containing protein 2 n=1 Tax=Bombina bombina TaxID=8345 RepID=UPI00235ACF43|nr:discoidin, CUB and LCCL domain-containing protein 2 [Bombina bombina]